MQLHANDGRTHDPGGSPFGCESGCARPRERGAVGARRGCFTNQRHWCQETTTWRTAGNGRVRRAPEGLRGMPAIDLSRHEPVRLVLDHKQFPVRHICETASVQLGSEPRFAGPWRTELDEIRISRRADARAIARLVEVVPCVSATTRFRVARTPGGCGSLIPRRRLLPVLDPTRKQTTSAWDGVPDLDIQVRSG
jgi:hypothetical protein